MEKYKGLLLILFFTILLLPIVVAEEQEVRFNAEQNQSLDILEKCRANGFDCAASYDCNFSSILPNQSLLISQVEMDRSGAFYNVTLLPGNQTTNGVYEATVDCSNSTHAGSNTFFYRVTPDGSAPISVGQGIVLIGAIFLMIIIAWLMAFLGLKSLNNTVKLSFIIFSVLLLVFSIGFSLNTLQLFMSTSDAIASNYSTLYVLFTVLLMTGGFALILYLVYVGVQAFYANRGLIR